MEFEGNWRDWTRERGGERSAHVFAGHMRRGRLAFGHPVYQFAQKAAVCGCRRPKACRWNVRRVTLVTLENSSSAVHFFSSSAHTLSERHHIICTLFLCRASDQQDPLGDGVFACVYSPCFCLLSFRGVESRDHGPIDVFDYYCRGCIPNTPLSPCAVAPQNFLTAHEDSWCRVQTFSLQNRLFARLHRLFGRQSATKAKYSFCIGQKLRQNSRGEISAIHVEHLFPTSQRRPSRPPQTRGPSTR